MTHGSIHLKNEGGDYIIKMHTTHDGHVSEAFLDCVLMPFWLYEHLDSLGASYVLIGLREWLKANNNPPDYMRQVLPLRTDATSFSTWLSTKYWNRWFAIPHVCSDERLLDYWGRNSPDIEVFFSEERLPYVKVQVVESGEDSEEEGEWFDYLVSVVRNRSGTLFDRYWINREERSITYRLDELFVLIFLREESNGPQQTEEGSDSG